jgi:two-component system, LytTR family, sensor kinase
VARTPLLIVQPLVENALRHGLAPRVEAGHVAVRASREKDSLVIEVADDGVGLPEGWSLPTTSGTGLKNLASRLAGEFGASQSLTVEPREGGGVRTTVRIPYATS